MIICVSVGAVKRYHRQSVTEGSVESASASLVRDKHTEGTSLRERGGGDVQNINICPFPSAFPVLGKS